MAAPVKITVGSHVWVKDKVSAWVEGKVTLIEDYDVTFMFPNENMMWTPRNNMSCTPNKNMAWSEVIVVTSKMHVKRLGTTSETVDPDQSSVRPKDTKAPELSVLPRDTKAPPEGVADMMELSHLHEPQILQNLATRYKNDNIYTYTGNILIAINPCKKIFPDLYDDGMMQKYKDAKTKDPHVFAIADIAYRSMIKEKKSNSILVSGESGAGKTETTKRLMTYLAHMGERSETEETTIEKKLLQSTPVLEAFGNAKTDRNDNSSRFGKYVEIQFDDKGRISGADIKTYLLERSRVCRISNPERNYHCFYLVFAAPPEDIKKYGLEGYHAKSFHYLNQSECYELDGVDYAPTYHETRKAMKTVGIIEEEQEAIFRVVAAILHLGNIEFANGKKPRSSVINEKSKGHLEITAELLMCDKGVLEKALINRVTKAGKEEILRNLEHDDAALSRDGLARTIYARLFDWLVEKINNSIGKVPNSKSKSIGLLDIYGFEKHEKNSFEQFCINYANEKLQKHFNKHVLESEKKVYEQEGIEWSGEEFVGNDDILKAIEESEGKIALLDDKSWPKSIDGTSAHQRSCMILCENKHIGDKFAIAHYAEKVIYEAKEFLEKNQDYVVPEHRSLLIDSKCPFIARQLFPQPREKAASEGNSLFTKSIGTCFKEQLQDLINTLEDAQPHYIRCVKPNNELELSNNFQMSDVSKQLHWSGVFEAIRVFCAGYPTRKIFEEFLKRFDIPPEVLEGINCKKKDACKMILDIVGLEGYKIGKTKVFLRTGVLAELDARMAPIKEAARGDLAKKLCKYLGQLGVADEILALKDELQAMKEQVEKEKIIAEIEREKVGVYIAKVENVEAENEELRKNLEDANIDVEELRKKIGEANTDALQANTNAEELRKKLEDANTNALRADTDDKELRKKLEDANTAALRANTDADAEELRKKLKDANNDAEELRKRLKDANTDAEELWKMLKDANTVALPANTDADAEELRKKPRDTNTDAEELRKELKHAVDEIKETEKANTDARAKIVELKDADSKVGQLLVKSLEEKLSNNGSRTNGSAHQGAANFQENQDLLTKCISQDLGYSEDRPVAAFIIYKCLLHWKSFDTERTRVFDHIIQTMGSAAIEAQDNNDVQAYWLSNSSTLLLLHQCSLNASGAASLTPRPSSRLGRFFKFALGALRPFRKIAGLQFSNGQQRQVEAKCSALLIKQQLTAFLEKIYGTMRDNLKKDISQLLELCIQAPRTSKASVVKGHPQANAIAHWQSIVKILNSYLNIMKANFVSPFLVRKVFCQIFYSINVQLFNSLLLHRECCSFSNGEYVKAGLAELQQWCFDATEEYAGSASDELECIRQAVGFLVKHEKPEKILEDITNDLFPVISSLRVKMTEDSNNAVSSSFLLDDDSSIPFSVDDISKSMQQISIADIDPPPPIRANYEFM